MILALRRRDAGAAPGAARSGRRGIARTCSPRTPTRSRRSRRRSRTTCSPWSNSSSATRCGCAPPTPAPTESARRLRDHRHRVSDRSRRARPSCSGSTAPPATPTAASRPSTTCSRACRRAAVLLVGLGRVVQDLLLWCTSEFGYLRLAGRLRAVQQHHAAEAQPGRARARARDRQQGARAGARRSCSRSTTRRSATSSTPRTTCSRSCSRCSRTRPARCRWSRRRWRDAAFDVARLAAARRGRAGSRSPSWPTRSRAITACRSRRRTRSRRS